MKPESATGISKREVQLRIKSGEFSFDESMSDLFNLNIYKNGKGEILVKNDNGAGFIWKSEREIYSFFANGEKALDVFNMKGWIKAEHDLLDVSSETLFVLSEELGVSISFDEKFLSAIDTIKIDNVVQQSKLYYSIIYFSCEIFRKQINGKLNLQQMSGKNGYKPIIEDHNGLIYIPYAEFVTDLSENRPASIKSSIELEHYRYKLNGD